MTGTTMAPRLFFNAARHRSTCCSGRTRSFGTSLRPSPSYALARTMACARVRLVRLSWLWTKTSIRCPATSGGTRRMVTTEPFVDALRSVGADGGAAHASCLHDSMVRARPAWTSRSSLPSLRRTSRSGPGGRSGGAPEGPAQPGAHRHGRPPAVPGARGARALARASPHAAEAAPRQPRVRGHDLRRAARVAGGPRGRRRAGPLRPRRGLRRARGGLPGHCGAAVQPRSRAPRRSSYASASRPGSRSTSCTATTGRPLSCRRT